MPKIVFGEDSITFIEGLYKKRIAIIKGGRSFSDRIKNAIETSADKTGAKLIYVTPIRNEPYEKDIYERTEEIKRFSPDLIIAVGGGSVIDTAKAVHLFYENENLTFEQASIPYSLPPLGKKATLIAMPTTVGTGSETTSAAVFIDPVTLRKKMILDNGIIPHYAVLDPRAVDSLPDSIVITTAMDALTHAVESAVALNGTVLSQAYSIQSSVMILQNLKKAVGKENETRKKAREKLLIASTLAGIAITNSCTGIAHSYDHVGPKFGLPHGKVCGLMLPYTMKMCGANDGYSQIAEAIGFSGNGERLLSKLTDYIFNLMTEIGFLTCFKDFSIDKEEYFKCAKIWSENSLSAFATKMSPAKMNTEKGLKLFYNCYYGIKE